MTAGADDVGVCVGRAGHLPDTDPVGVGLIGLAAAEEYDVRLALEDEDRYPDVVANPLTTVRDGTGHLGHLQVPGRGREDAVERDAQTGTPVHEEAVEDPRVWIDGVDVGHEAGGGLRLARRDHMPHFQSAEWVFLGRAPHQFPDLAEDVERPSVTGMDQRAVAVRCQDLEVHALDESTSVDAHLLRRHPDPGVTLGGKMPVEEAPVGRAVDAGRHVVPFHDDGAAEAQRVRRPSHHEPRPEVGLGTGCDVPFAVLAPLALELVRGRAAIQEELRLLVAEHGDVDLPHEVRGPARHLRNRCVPTGHHLASPSGRWGPTRLEQPAFLGYSFDGWSPGPAHLQTAGQSTHVVRIEDTT